MVLKITRAFTFILLVILYTSISTASPSVAVDQAQSIGATKSADFYAVLDKAITGPDGRVRVIVELEEPPLAVYRGGVTGLSATSPDVTGSSRLSVASQASIAYLNYLTAQQADFVQALGQQSPGAIVDYRYQVIFNGLALTIDPDEAAGLQQIAGVKGVYPDWEVYGSLDASLDVIKAATMWADLGGRSKAGDGVFVAVIDSGIRPDNPMFWGDDFAMPPGFPKGYCASHPGDPNFQCNNKIVAAQFYEPPFGLHPAEVPSPLDINGHGSHVAGIAAGNPVIADIDGDLTEFSGVAPAVYLMVYKALYHVSDPDFPNGLGIGSALVAALDDAVSDGADVINASWGSLPRPEFDTPGSFGDRLVTNITEAGVLFVTIAGNDGPDPETINCLGCYKDALAVAASTTSRFDGQSLSILSPFPVPAALTRLGLLSGTGPELIAPLTGALTYAGAIDPANSEGCQPFPAGAFANQLAVIMRGTCKHLDRVTHAINAGAIGVIVVNNRAGLPIIMNELETTSIPAFMISQNDGEAVLDWLAAHPDATGRLNSVNSRVSNDTWVDYMSNFSSAGPNLHANLLKPDITAPGFSILSAVSPDNPDKPGHELDYNTGTSMAAPHVTGAAALLMQLHPGWTPRQVKTALTSTAVQTLKLVNGTPATPFNMGAGRLDLDRARQAGLTFDQGSFAGPACSNRCTWTFTAFSSLEVHSTWTVTATGAPGIIFTVTPATLDLAPSGSQKVTITADLSALELGVWYFGEVILQPNPTGPVEARLPLALRPGQASIYLPVMVKN